MTNLISHKLKISLLAVAMTSLVACGGGNNNDAYKGETKREIITISTNFKNIINNMNTAKTSATDVSGNTSKLSVSNLASNINTNAISIPNSITDGPCIISGSKREAISQNTETGEITIETTFTNCSDITGVYENGYQLITSLEDTLNPRNSKYSFTSENYSYRDDFEHTVTTGTIFSTGSMFTEMKTELNLVIEDEIINEITKLEDFSITNIMDLNQETYTFSGKIYNSKDGYVTIETLEPIVTINGDFNPSSGVIRIIGDSEIAGKNAIVEIHFQPSDTYTIKIDLDGDGIFEINQSCNWSQPCSI